jgi:lipoprotein NlpI
LPVLPVTTAGTARGRDTPIIKQFVPHAGRGGRRHGQTHFVLGAKLGRDGMTAGLCFRSRHDDTLQRRGKLQITGTVHHYSRPDPFTTRYITRNRPVHTSVYGTGGNKQLCSGLSHQTDLKMCFIKHHDLAKCVKTLMKFIKNIFWLLAVLFLVTASAFGDAVDDFYNRGLARGTKGDLDGAIADFNKAIELKPDYADAYIGRGYAKFQKGDLDGALTDYNKAIELKPNYCLPYNNRGMLKNDKGDLGGAAADFTKAIELNPKDAWAYRQRGCLHYNSHAFLDALVDFRKSCELNSEVQDYSYFRIWLIRARLGEQEAATKELQTYWNNHKTGKPSDWPSKISSFLTGQLTESDFFEAAENTDKKKDSEQHCEAYFYAGSKRLIEGDKTTATNYFEKCLATDKKSFDEYQSTAAELRFLKANK